ncbi:MAG: choice-of-anchor D domain-containing protein [Candidatus Acidiferrales bacterium]
MSSRCSAIRVLVLAIVLGFVTACGLSGCSGLTSASSSPKPPAGALSANPPSVAFGNVVVGSSANQSFTLTNSGTANVTVSQVSISNGSFGIVGLSLPTTIAAGQSVTVQLQFAPQAVGSATGTASVTNNSSNSPISVALTGTGIVSGISASPTSAAFGNVAVGANSNQSVVLKNTDTSSITISQATASGAGFSLSGLSLPLTLNAGSSATFTATFAPTAAGPASGSIQITSNASNPSLAISLSGTGIQPQISATPSSVSFGSVATGTTSSQTIRLSNPGSANLTISQASVSGTGFSVTGLSVPITITPGTSMTFNAGFAPNSTGSATGSITLTSNAPNSPMTISLSGTGAAATLTLTATPPNLTFGNVLVGNTSSLNVSLTNTGNSSVTISQVTASGAGYSASGVVPNMTLTPGQSATLTVSLTPTSTGSATGSITVTSNASNSPTTITLTGGSHLVDLSWTASTSVVVGYNIYRGTVSGGPYATKLNSAVVPGTAYTDTGVVAGQTYFYVVTAVDANGVESVYSNQASALVPTP